MKFRKELGSEAVRDLIREACALAATLPRVNLHEPWPSDRRIEIMSDAVVVKTESMQQDK